MARPAQRQQQHAQPLQALALPEALSVLEASPARDFAAAAFAVAGSVALIKFFDTLERLGLINKVSGVLASRASCQLILLRTWPRGWLPGQPLLLHRTSCVCRG